jgi:hypothetical protein
MLETRDDGAALHVVDGGEPVLVFRYKAPKPYIHPLHAPGGAIVSLALPHDHLHHRGLWLAWPNVNGINFWEEHFAPEQTGHVYHRGFEPRAVASGETGFTSRQNWVTLTGEPFIDGRFGVTIHAARGDARVLSIDVALHAAGKAVKLGTPPQYHGLGYRCARSMDNGRILNANGDEGPEATNGARASWCNYSGQLDGIERADLPAQSGGWAGVTLFDHPTNPRHPTPWFTMHRPFGFMAPALSFHEPYAMAPDQTLTLRYGVLIHRGPADAGQLTRWYEEWLHTGRDA